MTSPVAFGIDVLRAEGFARLRGARVGLLTHPAAVDAGLVSTFRRLWDAPDIALVALFSPEHDLTGTARDGEAVASRRDPRTGLPIHSLYGETLKPTAEMLVGVDIVVCDVQDVGARFYTYIWTLSYILEACGERGVAVVVLDRPNPLGDRVDGPAISADLRSFVGRHDLPIQHGMTVGELARMMNALWNPTPCALDVIALRGGSRAMRWPEFGRAWVPTSPAMPTFATAAQYPGACLLEGTNLSEGRGTPLPFQVVGAPYIDGEALADRLNALALPGWRFRTHSFVPSAGKWAGELCSGVQSHLGEADHAGVIAGWLRVIATVRALYPDEFAWLPPHAPGALWHFDRLIGDPTIRPAVDAGAWPMDHRGDPFAATRAEFLARRAPFLLYD
jgi:uncharacterized protein YbbC (DUF1343 family)